MLLAYLRYIALLLLAAAPARAAPSTLVLGGNAYAIDAWPAVTMLADPLRTLSLEHVLARRAAFAVPQVPHANLDGAPGRTRPRDTVLAAGMAQQQARRDA